MDHLARLERGDGLNGSAAPEEDRRPLVSILVKALNEEAKIERCLRSCLAALEGLQGEVIVADSLSGDRTVELASRFPVTVVQLRRRRDRGCGVAAQLAFQHARGDYLYVIDGDMELPAGFLQQALAVLQSQPRTAGVGGQLEELNPDSDLSRIRGRRRKHAHAGVGPVDVLNGGGLYRRAAIEDAGGYLTHPALHAHEELELALRLRQRGWALERIAAVSMRHAGHTEQAFSLLGRRWRSGYAFGSGELLRLALGKPYFGRVVRHFPFHIGAWLWWLALAAGLALLPVTAWPLLAVAGTSAAMVLGMMAVKRSAYLGLFTVCAWHVFGAGAVLGALRLRRGAPTRPVECSVVHAPGMASAAQRAAERAVEHVAEREAAQPAVPAPAEPDSGNPYGASQVRRGLLHFMSGRLYTGVVQILLIAMYVRHMAVADYAAYTVLTALGGVLAALTLLGLERASMRYLPEARLAGSAAGLKLLIRTLTLVRLCILLTAVAVILVFAEPLLGLLQLQGHHATLWVAMVYLVASSTTGYQRYTLQSLMLQRELTLGVVVQMTLRLALVLGIVTHFDGMSAAWGLAAMAATEWVQAAMQWFFCRRHLRRLALDPAMAGPWRPDFREIRRYALLNGYSTVLRQFTGKDALRLIGATYLPAPAVAAFGFFQALAERVRSYLPVFLTRTLIEPVAMAHYLRNKDFASFNRVVSVAMKLNLLVIAPLAVWLALAADPALAAFTGGKFMEYSWVALLILLGLVSVSHWALIEMTANAVGASSLLAQGSTLAAVLTVGFLAASQPWAGVFGLAITGLLTTLVGNTFVVLRLRRAGFAYRFDWNGALRVVLNALAAGGLGYGVARLLGPRHALAGSLLALGLAFGLTAALCRLNRPFPAGEWDILQRMLPRRLRRRLNMGQAE